MWNYLLAFQNECLNALAIALYRKIEHYIYCK